MSGTTPAARRVDHLVHERDVLLASIEDLDREHAAGDIDDDDYTTLRAGYVERAAVALRALATTSEAGSGVAAQAPPARPPSWTRRARRALGRRRVRRVLVALGATCALGLVAVAATHAAGVRLPGESATGSVTLTSAAEVRQELDQAAVLASSGEIAKAISVYDTILAAVPTQPEALAYKGWFVRLAGIARRSAPAVAQGDALVRDAVRVAPGYAEARAFDAIALDEEGGDPRGAVVELRAMLRDNPSEVLLQSVGAEAERIFSSEHLAVPAALLRAAAAASASGSGSAG